jgi:large subunit ribosomal protein L11e
VVITDISVGESGDHLTRASKVLEQLTGQTLTSKSCYTVRQISIRRTKRIAVHVTIRGAKAEEILECGLRSTGSIGATFQRPATSVSG